MALPKAMPIPELPKRALAAPSSLQRSKFTLAPRQDCISLLLEWREAKRWGLSRGVVVRAAYLQNWYLEELLDRTGF